MKRLSAYDRREGGFEMVEHSRHLLQNKLTTPTKTNRKCGGTNAKLTTCVGINTNLLPTAFELCRRVDEGRERQTNYEAMSVHMPGGRKQQKR
jgi:hypothetical protein